MHRDLFRRASGTDAMPISDRRTRTFFCCFNMLMACPTPISLSPPYALIEGLRSLPSAVSRELLQDAVSPMASYMPGLLGSAGDPEVDVLSSWLRSSNDELPVVTWSKVVALRAHLQCLLAERGKDAWWAHRREGLQRALDELTIGSKDGHPARLPAELQFYLASLAAERRIWADAIRQWYNLCATQLSDSALAQWVSAEDRRRFAVPRNEA